MRSEPVRDAGQREGEHRGPSAAIEGNAVAHCVRRRGRCRVARRAAAVPLFCVPQRAFGGTGPRTRPPQSFLRRRP